MKNFFFLLLTILVFSIKVNANTGGVNALLLQGPSDYKLSILLDEQPIITFSDDDFVITTHMGVISIPSASVSKYSYYYEDDETRINNASQLGSALSFDGKHLSMKSLPLSTGVQVYNADGILVSSATTDSRGNVSLLVPQKQGAVYFVKASTLTFKISIP